MSPLRNGVINWLLIALAVVVVVIIVVFWR